MAFYKAEDHEARNHHADLRGQELSPRCLKPRAARTRRLPQPSCLTHAEEDHEGGEKPVADHHNEEDVVDFDEMPREPVLQREDESRGDHHADAGGILGSARASTPRLMCRFAPKPPARSTVNPASARERRTAPAAV